MPALMAWVQVVQNAAATAGIAVAMARSSVGVFRSRCKSTRSLSDMTRKRIRPVPRCSVGSLVRMMEFCICVAWFMHARIS